MLGWRGVVRTGVVGEGGLVWVSLGSSWEVDRAVGFTSSESWAERVR